MVAVVLAVGERQPHRPEQRGAGPVHVDRGEAVVAGPRQERRAPGRRGAVDEEALDVGGEAVDPERRGRAVDHVGVQQQRQPEAPALAETADHRVGCGPAGGGPEVPEQVVERGQRRHVLRRGVGRHRRLVPDHLVAVAERGGGGDDQEAAVGIEEPQAIGQIRHRQPVAVAQDQQPVLRPAALQHPVPEPGDLRCRDGVAHRRSRPRPGAAHQARTGTRSTHRVGSGP